MHLQTIRVVHFVILLVLKIPFESVKADAPDDLAFQFQQFNHEYEMMWWLHQSADWNYSTNVTGTTDSARIYVFTAFSEWMQRWKLWARGINGSFLPSEQKQILNSMSSGVVFMNPDDTRRISELKSKLTEKYSSAKINLPAFNVSAEGESEVISLVAQLRDPDVLKEVWKSWRHQVAGKSQKPYLQLVSLTNKASRENGYSDVGEAWREELGIDNVITTISSLWNDVKDFYKELHTYTMHKLRTLYGETHFRSKTLIPAHLLGSLWGENWASLYDILIPYPKESFNEISSVFNSKGYTVFDILHKAETLYTTMGFDLMKPKFWNNSMFVKPRLKQLLVDCHAASYDFALNDDYRVRMCAEVKDQSFYEIVHEMGHIHYYMSYHNLPMMMRGGANSAFHEAVGETMVYAAQSPKCLKTLNIQSFNQSEEVVVNTLMKQALSKFVLLPWALTVEIWRYSLFSGEIKEKDMMLRWWELRKNIQGIEPPDVESSLLFDPGSKYHVALHIPYIRYFLSRFLEHQFLEALCNIAGQDLHDCCFITSLEAGAKMKHMLSLGASVSWQDALQVLTGQRNLSSKSIMKYYKPLYDWLVKYNIDNNIQRY